MKRMFTIVLIALIGFAWGCQSKPAKPVEETPEIREAAAQEDAAVDEAESQNK